MRLIIVESPTKARTLARFLGREFQIEASMGHLRDLPAKKLGVDPEHNFAPEYVIDKKKQAIVSKLKSAAKNSRAVILATDPDREGEAIAWHLQYILKKEAKSFSRIAFHEITEKAINAALKNPGQVNLKLVDSQQARRILDRLVGYQLSPILWRKIRRGLSAGRVQSVAVRLVVEREEQIKKFTPEEYWEVKVELAKSLPAQAGGRNFFVQLIKELKNKAESRAVVNDLEAAEYQVKNLTQKTITRHAYPPLITSTMQRLAGNRFGWSAKKTMTMAQHLYENGWITYHRTDSVNLAEEAVVMARKYIERTYGKDYLPDRPNFYKAKNKNVQGAHEAIRPTKLETAAELGKSEQRLYQLIWQRFTASQMNPAVFKKTVLTVKATGVNEYELKAETEQLEFDGWMKVSDGFRRTEAGLPAMAVGDKLQLIKVLPEQKFTQPPLRYTEASLIKELEKRGIGRPSTYAPILSTIQDRYYVEKEDKKLKPTAIGETVTRFLITHFETVMDYDFTAGMEANLDEIETGKINSQELLKNFYKPFDIKLKEVIEKAARVKIAAETTGEKCPECHEGEIVIRLGRFGKFLSCSRFPDCKYTAKYKEIVSGAVCPDCGAEVVIKRTRRGKTFYGCANYPKCKWASWKKPSLI